MKTIFLIDQVPDPSADGTYFYYVISILMGLALIWIFQKYIGKLDATITKLTESDIKQNFYIEDHHKRIETLENPSRIVQYKNP